MAQTASSSQQFLGLSSILTGFNEVELQGTGMLEVYYRVVNEIIDSRIVGRLLLTYQKAVERCGSDRKKLEARVVKKIVTDSELGPLAKNIVTLWYLGQWNQLPREWRDRWGASANDRDYVISAEAYAEGLAWVAMGAHPMGTKQQGYGAWAFPPPPPPPATSATDEDAG